MSRTYRLSPAGRRHNLLMLAATLLVWAFALWSFGRTINLSYQPALLWPSLLAALAGGLSVERVLPALLMLALIIASPLLVWNLLAEWEAAYTPTDAGLRYETIGITLLCPWAEVIGLHREDADDAEDQIDELVCAGDLSAQIGHPLLSMLHRQAHGRRRLLISPGVADRDALLQTIRQATGPAGAPAPSAGVA